MIEENLTEKKPKKKLIKLLFLLAFVAFITITAFFTVKYFQKKYNDDLASKRIQAEYIDTINIRFYSESQGFYPMVPEEGTTYNFAHHYYEGLTGFDKDLRVSPLLARSWENPNDFTWRFRLKDSVLFHNEKPVTADDVEASLNMALENENTQGLISMIEKVQKVDNETIDIITTGTYPILPNILTKIFILPKELIENETFDSPIGTGPYRFSKQIEKDVYLERFEKYHLEKPKAKNAVLRVVESDDDTASLLAEGSIDIAETTNEIFLDKLSAVNNIKISSFPGIHVGLLYLDSERDKSPYIEGPTTNPLSDIKVRTAIELALEKDNIAKATSKVSSRAASQLNPPAIFGHNFEIITPKQDIEKAKSLMKEAGYEEGFTLTIDAGAIAQPIIEEIKKQLKEINIEVKPNLMQPTRENFMKLITGDTSAFYLAWGSVSGDGLESFESIFSSSSAMNMMGYKIDGIDDLIEKAKNTFNQSERKKILEQIALKVDEQKKVIALTERYNVYAHSKNIEFSGRIDGHLMATDAKGVVPEELKKDYGFLDTIKRMLSFS
jgi:peptide/nickel transport system substrate-binding protein